MKTLKFKFLTIVLAIATSLAFMQFFTSCSNDDSGLYSPLEIFGVRMFVTNDAGDDLIINSDKYYHTINKFQFDTWKIFLDGKLIQTADSENKFTEREVNYQEAPGTERKNIRLSSNMAIQEQIEDPSKKHVAEYAVTSSSLFKDSAEHTIRMELRKVKNEQGYLSLTECNVSVDGVEMEVYYPVHYKGLFSESPYDYVIEPYFILNVDAL